MVDCSIKYVLQNSYMSCVVLQYFVFTVILLYLLCRTVCTFRPKPDKRVLKLQHPAFTHHCLFVKPSLSAFSASSTTTTLLLSFLSHISLSYISLIFLSYVSHSSLISLSNVVHMYFLCNVGNVTLKKLVRVRVIYRVILKLEL